MLIRMGEYATVEEAGLADSETFYQLLANLHELERLECVGIVLGDHGMHFSSDFVLRCYALRPQP